MSLRVAEILAFRFGVLARAVAALPFAIAIALCLPMRASAAPQKSGAGDDLFTNSSVRRLRIEISNEAADTLRQYSWKTRKQVERTYVPATIREGDSVWTNVGIHLKGAYGSFRPLDDKPGFTLKFDKFSDGQRFHGLQKISLNNSVQDPSYLSDNIARELHRQAGVPTPRVDYATVELNGRYLGFYVLSEAWNKQFLKRYFTNVNGNFYDFGGAHDIDKPTAAAFGDAPTNHQALESVVAAAREKDHTKRIAQLRKTVDLDRFLSMTALDTLIWNWDGYANNKNNYRAFVDLQMNRVVFMPHGMDMTFSKPDAPIVTGRAGIVIRSLLETVEGRRLYLERLSQLRAKVFDVPAIMKRIDELNARLEPVLTKDGMLSRQQSSANWYRTRILARQRDVDAQLTGIKELLHLDQYAKAAITSWTPGPQRQGVTFDTSDQALHLKVIDPASVVAWNSLLWLEEGRYRLHARVKTMHVQGVAGSSNSGAGLRVWSTRKMSSGSSWSWLPLESARDSDSRRLIPALPNTAQQNLTGNNEWTAITHEFDLRQPIADLQIKCVLENATGEAWFDTNSLQIERRSAPKSALANLKEESFVSLRLGTNTVSKGLVQVHTNGDGPTSPAYIGGKECHEVLHKSNRLGGYLYLKIDAAQKPFTLAKVEVEYFDTPDAAFYLQYDSRDTVGDKEGAYAPSEERVAGKGTQTWKKTSFILEEPRFQGRQIGNADFRLCVTGPQLFVRSVTVRKLTL